MPLSRVKWSISEDTNTGVDRISIVETPAIESDFIKFSKDSSVALDYSHLTDKELEDALFEHFLLLEMSKVRKFEVPQQRFQELEGQNLLVGPAMIPYKLIYREREDGTPYEGYFGPEDVAQAALTFSREGLANRFNVEHSQSEILDGVFLLEQEIVKDTTNTKAAYYGYEVPVGTWWVTLKVENQEFWDTYITTERLKGFSVEALLTEEVLFKQIKH